MKNFYLSKMVAVVVALTSIALLPLTAQETLQSRIKQIQENYGVHFVYDASLQGTLDTTRVKSAPAASITLEEALRQTFEGAPVAWQLRGRNVILKTIAPAPKVRRFTLNGYITDARSGETLIGAGVLSGQDGAAANEFGYYTLTLPAGRHHLQIAYIGYDAATLELDLQRDTTINFALQGNSELDAARIVARKDAGLQSAYLGSIEVPMVQIRNTPVLFGEADPVKTLQLLPGVQGGVEGFSGLYVRGGGPEENLVLLDGVSVYNMDHMLGLFSVFQPEAVKNVTLYKGSFPARYGGRISSIVDIRTNDGNMKETHGSLTVGLLNDRFHLEGPIVKDKLSYSLSARGLHTAVLSPLMRLLLKDEYYNYYFYDLNGKLTWRISDKDRLYLSTYYGTDAGKVILHDHNEWTSDPDPETGEEGHRTETFSKQNYGIAWGNTVTALRWNHVFGSKLFSNSTVFYNRYRMDMDYRMHETRNKDGEETVENNSLRFRSGIQDIGARIDFDWTPTPSHLVKYGAEYTWHDFRPDTFFAASAVADIQIDDKLELGTHYFGSEASLYMEDNISLGGRFSLNPGLRLSWFHTQGQNYLSLQPRMSIKAALDNGLSFKAGYSRMAQYVHLLSTSAISLPLDLWAPITKDIPPISADHYSIGAYYDGLSGWEFSLEGYWKEMFNLIDYKDGGMTLVASAGWENQIEIGRGRAAGVEFFVQKTGGKTTGWVSYALARSIRWFDGGTINLGRPYLYKYDRTHTFNLTLNHKFSEKVDISVSWIFASGSMLTLPTRANLVFVPGSSPKEEKIVDSRNNFRLPPSHRLNLGINLRHRTRRGNEAIWNFSIYNAYNAMNPHFVLPEVTHAGDYEDTEMLHMQKITILPIIPAFSYTYNF